LEERRLPATKTTRGDVPTRSNAGPNANAMLIYSNTHDDHKANTHIPSETRRRTCTVPTTLEEIVIGGPVLDGPQSLNRGPRGPCQGSRDPLSLEERSGPWTLTSLDLNSPIHHQGLIPRFSSLRSKSSWNVDRGRDLISPPGFAPVKEASTRFQAPLGGPDRGVACLLVRVRRFPHSGPGGEGC